MSGCSANDVPMLQRATIGLIYRLLTYHDVEFSNVGDDIDDGAGESFGVNKIKDENSCRSNTRDATLS